MYKLLVLSIACIIIVSACNLQNQSIEFQEYYSAGYLLYQEDCSQCHKKDGKGFENIYPPLADTDFLDNNEQQVACIIRYGQETPLRVNGKLYEIPMPPHQDYLDIDIAQVMTYIYNTWGNKRERVTVEEVNKWLKDCGTE